MTDSEELDNASLQMNLQHAGTPIVFLRLETYNALEDVVHACRGLQQRLVLPWEEGNVTEEERSILEAMAAFDIVK